MALMSGKRALMETLKAESVEYIFGNPGTSESPIMDALESYPELKYMLVLQEGVAVGMADAYARATGRPSFVNLHIETGLANSISLLHNAHEGGTPLVLTSGNKDIRELAQGRTDLADMVRLFTKWTAEVTHPQQLPSVLRRAFKEAKTPPTGPTYVGFSANSLDDEADVEIVPSPDGYLRTAPNARAIEDATRILASASNPMILVSDRVGESRAADAAVRVAELLGARVYASLYSDMNFPTSHPQYFGSLRVDFPESADILSSADAVLAVGRMATGYYMFSDPVMRYFGRNAKLVHIDPDPGEVGRTQPTEVGIVADPKVALDELAESLDVGMSGSAKEAAKGRSESLAAEKAASRESWRRRVKDRWDHSPMSPERMMAEVAAAIPPDTTIADDAVTTRAALYNSIDFDRPGSIIGARGGALGWGIGGAMGLKLANPESPVVAIVGDGSAMMTAQGFWTHHSPSPPSPRYR